MYDKILAVKVARAAFGMSLKESRALVERLEDGGHRVIISLAVIARGSERVRQLIEDALNCEEPPTEAIRGYLDLLDIIEEFDLE